MTTLSIKRSTPHMAPSEPDKDMIAKIMDLLEKGKSEDEIRAAMQDDLAVEPINAGIIRTRQGALMVRVSDARWPIAMYKRDWRILLSKIPAIEKALEELDIAEENPNPTKKEVAPKAA